MTQKEINERLYRRRKENGLCPRCGRPLDREGHYCSECLEKAMGYQRRNREFYRKNHLCTECGKNAVPNGEKTCPECRAKAQESRKPLTREQKARYGERFRKQQNLLYKERLRSGICARRGKRKATNGYVTCAICRNKNADLKRIRSKTSPRSERVQNGLCYFCDNPVKTGYKVCEKHYQMSVENVKKRKGTSSRTKACSKHKED